MPNNRTGILGPADQVSRVHALGGFVSVSAMSRFATSHDGPVSKHLLLRKAAA